MIKEDEAASILLELRSTNAAGAPLRRVAMELLSSLPNYDWCGVYILRGDMLLLDEYVGAATEHVEIPVGRGVCGTAVDQDQNQVVHDVHDLENYLSCNILTKSEIVVLIRDEKGLVLGQVDIDSHKVNGFDDTDEAFLMSIADVLAERWE